VLGLNKPVISRPICCIVCQCVRLPGMPKHGNIAADLYAVTMQATCWTHPKTRTKPPEPHTSCNIAACAPDQQTSQCACKSNIHIHSRTTQHVWHTASLTNNNHLHYTLQMTSSYSLRSPTLCQQGHMAVQPLPQEPVCPAASFWLSLFASIFTPISHQHRTTQHRNRAAAAARSCELCKGKASIQLASKARCILCWEQKFFPGCMHACNRHQADTQAEAAGAVCNASKPHEVRKINTGD
jgi:hypothetical protein